MLEYQLKRACFFSKGGEELKDIIERLSSYNIFNYLLPGVIFVVVSKNITNTNMADENLILTLFVCYFVGLVISRLGSLVVEPLLKWLGYLKFSSYDKYVEASISDPVIQTLSEANNMYRTMISLFLCLFLFVVFDMLVSNYPLLYDIRAYLLLAFMTILFTFSYIKQTAFISKRVESFRKRKP